MDHKEFSLEELMALALTEEEKKPKGFATVNVTLPNDVLDFVDAYQINPDSEGTPQRILYHFYEQWRATLTGTVMPQATRPLFYKILNSKFAKQIKDRVTYNMCASPHIKLDKTTEEQLLSQMDLRQGNLWRKKRRYSKDAKEYRLYLKLKAKYEKDETD